MGPGVRRSPPGPHPNPNPEQPEHGTTRRDVIMASATADETISRTDLAARAVDVVKVFGEGPTAVRALDGVSVDFPSGRFTAIMGPSGSGKSTFMHCLAGLDKVTSGQVLIGGTELNALSDKQLNLLRTLTAAENIELPMALAGTRADRSWVDRVIDAVGLRDRLSHRPSELSGGQQQRVAAARALASSPSIVFADEPTGNLDSNASAELLGFLRRSVDEFGQTIVMVTHDPGAAAHADHVLFLQDGKVVDEMPNPTADKVLDLMKKLGG